MEFFIPKLKLQNLYVHNARNDTYENFGAK